ncbi:glycosyltransferase family 39 protein [Alicyclobacillus tolerans]|uniref:glycosyltransferase family 39 protein n=1 Tax=Alicyclobacillus tolerans TaxID=90970 RepID=UPI001F37D912|nr:glycosyltransferase family 39 protein [Alicyclobacillus tolerans]MCF8565914.1 glycosyltransferase family 39 protein [Alicyclobacillus tolerans]
MSHVLQNLFRKIRSIRNGASRHTRLTLSGLLVAAAVWRISEGVLMPISYLTGDMVHYDHLALTMLNHHVYSYWSTTPDAQVTPGYPLFLALCYVIANLFYPDQHAVQLLVATIAQEVLSVFSIYLVYKLSRRILPVSLATGVSILWFLYPTAAWAPRLLLTETLYTTLLLLSVYLFYTALDRPSVWIWAWCGLAFGATTLVRPTAGAFLLAPVVVWAWRFWRRKPLNLRFGLAYGAVFIAALVPWWVRNFISLHRIILTDTDSGNPLLYGSDPNFQVDQLSKGLHGMSQGALAVQRILYGFSHEFWTYLWWYTGDKLWLLFGSPWFVEPSQSSASVFADIGYAWLHLHIAWVILGLLGVFAGFKHPDMRFISVLVLLLMGFELPFIPIPRYSYPVMPFMFIGAGYFAKWVGALELQRRALTKRSFL